MKTAVAVAVLVAVLAGSLLDLGLGALWVATVLALLTLGGRRRWGPSLALAGTVGLGVAGLRLGWFPPPPTASYEVDWVFGGRAGAPRGSGEGGRTDVGPAAVVQARLRERRTEEIGRPPGEFADHAAAAVALARRLGTVRARAPREAGAVEEATRRLALTLTSAEFQDLARRQARAAAYLDAIETRLHVARDESEVAELARALDPAVMAAFSLRPLAEDLARVQSATSALLGALGHPAPEISAGATARYEETEGRTRFLARYVVRVDPPLAVVRVGLAASAGTFGVAAEGRSPVEVRAGAWVDLPPATRALVATRVWEEPVTVRPVRSPLRRIGFHGIRLSAGPPPREVALDVTSPEGLPLRLLLRPPAPVLAGVWLPRRSLHHASAPGTLAPDGEEDVWTPDAPTGQVALELVPPGRLLRSAPAAALRPYLYRPNPAAALAVTGLAALTALLVARPGRMPA